MTPQTKDSAQSQNQGIDRIVDRYRQQFRVPENLDHYSDNDFHDAERQYLRFCLDTGSLLNNQTCISPPSLPTPVAARK